MIYITDLKGEVLPVRDLENCLKQVEVLIWEDLPLAEQERCYWIHLCQCLTAKLKSVNAKEILLNRKQQVQETINYTLNNYPPNGYFQSAGF